MAEFQDVVRNRNRLCAAQSNSCADCVLNQKFSDCESGAFIDGCAAEFEHTVMDWAKEHPEPQYPTQHEWQHENFPDAGEEIDPCIFMSVDDAGCHKIMCDECRNQPIPADIAKKLGIAPLEV